jgi:hypothetical protein
MTPKTYIGLPTQQPGNRYAGEAARGARQPEVIARARRPLTGSKGSPAGQRETVRRMREVRQLSTYPQDRVNMPPGCKPAASILLAAAGPPGQSHPSRGMGCALEWLTWGPRATLAPDSPRASSRRSSLFGVLGLALALTRPGGQHCGPVGSDRVAARRPAPRRTLSPTRRRRSSRWHQLPCWPNGRVGPAGLYREGTEPWLVSPRRSSADTPLATVFPQEETVKLDVSAPT